MKYTAQIVNKTIVNGILTVQVEYRSEDGNDIFSNLYSTNGAQDESWLSDSVNKKLTELENIHTFADSIEIGKTPEIKPKVETELTPRELFKQKSDEFEKLISVLNKGYITSDNEEFVTLNQWLKDNWLPEYLDMV